MKKPLDRVLEPELMDTPEDAADYDSMDHSGVNRLFVVDFLEGYRGGRVLDIGTGTAQIPIELCQQYPGAIVDAVDAAMHMLAVAEKNIKRAGFSVRINLHLAPAQSLPFAGESFPAVMSNSIVHHIPEPRQVIAEMVRVLAPGGWLLVRDLLRPIDVETLNRLVDLHAAGANKHQRGMFRDSLNASLTLEEIRQIVHSLGYNQEDVKQTSARHWTWATRRQP